MILRKRSQITEDFISNLEIKPIYISRVKTLPDLKEKISEILPKYLKSEISKEKIRLWKVDCRLEELKKFLLDNQVEIEKSDKKFDVPELTYLECKIIENNIFRSSEFRT